MTGNGKIEGRIERAARLRWVPLAQMRVNPLAQRDLNQARVSQAGRGVRPGADGRAHGEPPRRLVLPDRRPAPDRRAEAVAALVGGPAGPVLDAMRA